MQYIHDGNLTSFEDYGYEYSGSSGNSAYGGYGYAGFGGYGGDIEMEALSLSYDNDQRLTEVASSLSETANQYNTYDHDSQLTNWSTTGFDSGGTNYGFDSNGNVSGTGDSVGDGDAQLSANGYSYQFDAAGNMTQQTDPSGNVTTYSWDNRGRLSGLTVKNSSGVTQKVVGYIYDAMNQLIGESVTPYSGGVAGTTTTQRFAYDPLTGQMQLAFNGSGTVTDRYLWGPLVDQVLADEKVWSTSYAGTVNWIATEATVTDVWEAGSTQLSDHIQYNGFGGIYSQTESWNAPLFGDNGEYTDPATGMQYHSEPGTGVDGRWYLPWSERWASKDPIFPFSGSNPYEYCGNDPTSNIDPSGLAQAAGVAGYDYWIQLQPWGGSVTSAADPFGEMQLPPDSFFQGLRGILNGKQRSNTAGETPLQSNDTMPQSSNAQPGLPNSLPGNQLNAKVKPNKISATAGGSANLGNGCTGGLLVTESVNGPHGSIDSLVKSIDNSPPPSVALFWKQELGGIGITAGTYIQIQGVFDPTKNQESGMVTFGITR